MFYYKSNLNKDIFLIKIFWELKNYFKAYATLLTI